ncbi:hypothetical protein Tco_0231287 [Tanacetum coccineum]
MSRMGSWKSGEEIEAYRSSVNAYGMWCRCCADLELGPYSEPLCGPGFLARSDYVDELVVAVVRRQRYVNAASWSARGLGCIRWVLPPYKNLISPSVIKKKENLAVDHLSRLENPHKDVLENKDINENFPLETLGVISSESTHGFADTAKISMPGILS